MKNRTLWAYFQDYFFLLLWKAGEFFSDVHPEHLGAPVSRLTEVGSLGKTDVCRRAVLSDSL